LIGINCGYRASTRLFADKRSMAVDRFDRGIVWVARLSVERKKRLTESKSWATQKLRASQSRSVQRVISIASGITMKNGKMPGTSQAPGVHDFASLFYHSTMAC
jgi:hypothetical protein